MIRTYSLCVGTKIPIRPYFLLPFLIATFRCYS